MTTLVSVRGLSKVYTQRKGLLTRATRLHVLNDVSFEVGKGEVVALVGESGCGKSTTARLLARLMEPSKGEVFLDGKEVVATRRPPREFRSRVQMIFQDPFGSLNPVHTVGHHLERPLRRLRGVRAADATARAAALLDSVGLSPGAEFAKKHPHQLSGGQRQRVAIARALAAEPDLLLADEPTSMLDVSLRTGILNLLSELRTRRGIACLYITHDLASARYLADRVLVMYAGQIVEAGPSAQVLDAPSHPYTRLLLDAVPDPRRAAGSIARPLAARSGGAPTLTAPPSACSFADRCPEVVDRCRREVPVLHTIGAGRLARCHLREGPPAASA
jgi:peptide/nickel transport system ATP-binding protein